MDEVTKKLREFAQGDKEQRKQLAKMLLQLSDEEIKAIVYDWNIWGRDKQLAPEGKWRFWVLSGGRSSGKTRGASEWVIQRAREGKGPIALIGKTSGDVRDVMVELGPSSIMSCSPPDFRPIYEPSKRRLTWPNGVTATTFSGDEPGQLKGPQHQTIWIDELPKFDDPQALFDDANFGLRIGDSRCLISTTPTPHEIMKSLYKQWEADNFGKTRYVIMPTQDNAANVDIEFIKDIEDKYKGTRLYRQEVLGEILWESEDALFSTELLDKYRVKEEDLPPLDVIVVSIDPAVTNTKTSDTTALTVCGLDKDGHGYVLYSSAVKANPLVWAQKAVALFDNYGASYVVVEVNNGGDLIKTTLEQVRRNLPIKEVRASTSKIARMEPISLLAEQGKVHIVGVQQELEDQLVRYNGKGPSPDLYDSACWGLSAIMLTGQKNTVKSTQFYL